MEYYEFLRNDNYKLEATLPRRQDDKSIFRMLKYNSMHFFANASDAFLVKDDESCIYIHFSRPRGCSHLPLTENVAKSCRR